MTEEVMLVPTKEFDQLVQYYKGEITDNALSNEAGRLVAVSHVILQDKSIPDSLAITKPLARERGRLDKIAKQHGIDYSKARNLQDKWKADTKMIKAIDKLPGKKTLPEKRL